jgi:hypothetical protein
VSDDVSDEDMEYIPSFEGECTCEHERDQHSWGDCGAVEDGITCSCAAGWCE